MMFGDDALSLREELGRWQAAFTQKHGDLNMEVLDGLASPADIKSAIIASPFLGEKRLVVVNNFQAQQKAESKKDLKDVLASLPDSTILVLVETSAPDKRSVLYKFLIQEATLKPFNKPEGAALTKWILDRTHKHGGSLDFSVAGALAARVGDDLWQLENEIQKLTLYAAGAPITKAMIEALVSANLDQNIFEMTDRLARKDIAGTLKLFRELHEQGHESPYLFAMVVRQFRLMLEMKALHEEGLHPKAIALKMKAHPFVITNTLKYCHHFSQTQLRSALNSLLDIDRRLKTGLLHFRAREEDQYLLTMERLLLRQ